MSEELKKKITEYLEYHSIATVATVSAEGKPNASAVEYVNDGFTLYFMSMPKSRKTQDIKKNPVVALTINESVLDMRGTQGIQYEGKAKPVEDGEQVKKCAEMFYEKFVIFRLLKWDLTKALFMEVTPARIDFIDYRKKFGHKEKMEF